MAKAPTANQENLEGQPTVEKVQEHVSKIWRRARSNAFAHRYASETYKELAEIHFNRQVILGIFAILAVMLVYIVTSTEQLKFFGTEILSVALTFTSVTLSMSSLYYSIKQNYSGFERLQMNHDHNQHSYLLIAQRAREVSFPEIELGRAIAILEDLERDFQVLKARGQEPSDKHFEEGNKLIYGIAEKAEGEMQSFQMHPTNSSNDQGQS